MFGLTTKRSLLVERQICARYRDECVRSWARERTLEEQRECMRATVQAIEQVVCYENAPLVAVRNGEPHRAPSADLLGNLYSRMRETEARAGRLFKALQALVLAAESRENTMGDQSDLVDARRRLAEAAAAGRRVIAGEASHGDA